MRLMRYIKPYKWQVMTVVVLTALQSLSQLYLPHLMSGIVDKGIAGQNISFIVETGLVMLGFSLVAGICTVAARLFAAKSATGFARDLRRDIFEKVQSYSLAEFEKTGTASLITRTTNDVTQIQNALVMAMAMLLSAPVMCIGGILMAVQTGAGLSWLIGVSVGLMSALVLLAAVKVMPLFKSLQKKIDRVSRVMRENLTGIRVIRAFNKTEYEQRRFEAANRDLTDTSVTAYRWIGALMPAILLALNLSTVAVIWFGGLHVELGQMQVGDLIAFQQYVMQIMFAVIMATMMFVMLPRAFASAERINEVLDIEPAVIDRTDVPLKTVLRGHVEFRNVSFTYQNAKAPVLSNISFEAAPGEVTAVIGSTGSGKSTLVKLIPRFFDVSEGAVLVDGVDVRDYPQDALRLKIGYVPQRASLVSGTVADNLRYGDPSAGEPALMDALHTAQASGFVTALEGGLLANVSQDGSNFSGGQKQRLSIARALVRHPEIYIFDDSFSALDYKTDLRLRQALAEKTKEAAVLIVAQRISTVMNADKIIVLDDGRIAGQGTHAELLDGCDTYYEIVASQLSAEELA